MEQYVTLNKTCLDISSICNCHNRTIHSWLVRHNIPRRVGGWSPMPEDQKLLRSQWAREHHELLVASTTNHIHTLESRRKQGMSIKGSKHWNWQGGKSKPITLLRFSLDYQLLRLIIFKRDNFTCQMCGKRGGQLIMHHIIPVSLNIELALQDTNTITVCRSCHARLHRGENGFESLQFKENTTVTRGSPDKNSPLRESWRNTYHKRSADIPQWAEVHLYKGRMCWWDMRVWTSQLPKIPIIQPTLGAARVKTPFPWRKINLIKFSYGAKKLPPQTPEK